MIAVTDDYKAAVISKNQEISARIEIDYSDYNIDNSITSTVNYPARTSDGDQMADGIESPTYYWFDWSGFEWNCHLRSSVHTTKEKGAWSSIRSNDDAEFPTHGAYCAGYACAGYTTAVDFTDYPRFRINFAPRTISSLKAIFDDERNEYAVDFDINVYTDDYSSPAHNEPVTSNSSYKWTKTITPVQAATAIEIVVKKWNGAGYRAKIIELFTSYQQKYSISDVLKLRVYEESKSDANTNPIGNMTANQLNLTLINLDRWFDNDNPESPLAGNVTKNRRVRAYITINSTDEIPLGAFYTNTWKVNNEKLTAELSARDIIQLMAEQNYLDSQFITPGIPQTFNYTTTADFSLFTVDNVIAANDELQFGGAYLLCSGSTILGNVAGYTVPYNGVGTVSIGSLYCGTAEKTISFNYTSGTSVTMNLTASETKPTGTNILYYASYKSIDEWNLLNNGQFTFTPEDITDTTQEVKILVYMITQSPLYALSVQDIQVVLTEKVTLYALAAKVIEDFDNETNLIQGQYEIAQGFADYEIESACFEPQTYRDALKKIIEAGGGRCYQRRDQYLILETFKDVTTASKSFDDSLLYEKINPVKPWDIFNRVSVLIYEYIQVASSEDLAKINISIADTEVLEYTIKFSKFPVDTITYSGLPGSVTITDSVEYTWGVWIEVTNASGSDQDFELTVEGYPYEATGNRIYSLDDTESTRVNGVIELEIDNPLIQTEAQAQAIAEALIAAFAQQRSEIEIDNVPDPALELGDTIKVGDDYFLINKSEIDLSASQLVQKIGGNK